MMTGFRSQRWLGLLLALVFFAAASASAQTSNGTIAGSITDKSGAGVPEVAIAVTSDDRGGESRTTQTDSVGGYRVEALLPGKYTVTMKKGGFSELKIAGVDVRASFTTTVNGVLEIAATSTTITVEAAAGQELQTQSGELSANLTSKEIQNLPIFGLNPVALALTLPGVTPPSARDDFTNGVGLSVNGTRPRANNFLIDGQDNNDNAINGQAFQTINPDAIQEVTVLTNSYSAEFGRGGGSVTNQVIKSGTNRWHGSAFEIHRNSALAAIPAESKLVGVSKNPVDIENVFGFSLGGPIVKNKLFFFASPEWDRERSTANGATITIPTANGITTLQSLGSNANVAFLVAALNGLVAPTASGTIALGPDASGNPRPAVEVGQVQRSGIAQISDSRQVYSRVDWNATERDTVTARYIRSDLTFVPDLFNFATALAPFDSQQGGPSESFGASWVHTFSPRVVNEFRTSYTNIDFGFFPTPATAANPLSQHAFITITGSGFPALGLNSALPQSRGHRSYQYQDALSYSVKTHTFKGGADINHLSVVDAIPFNPNGSIDYRSGGTFTALANFVDDFTGSGGSVSRGFGNPVVKPFVTSYAPYLQDTWRVRPNFTLTLGLRYEYFGTPENTLPFPAIDASLGIGLRGATFPNSFSAPQKSDRNNFAPRVGIAYTPRFWTRAFGQDKTVFRAGYGIFYDSLFTNILDNTGSAQPNNASQFVPGGSGRGVGNARGVLAGFTPLLNPFGGITTIAGGLVSPLTHQWNFDIQRELPGNFVVTAAYVGTRGIRLFVNQEYNPRINFGPRVNRNFGPITVRTNGGDSIYHSAQLTVDRKFSKGFLLRGAYTYSKLIDTGSEVFITSGLSSFSQDPFNQAGDRGLSAFDRRHRFAFTYVWDLPYVHRSEGGWMILKALTEGWQSSGTVSFTSGSPETVTVGFDVFGDGRGGNDRPNLNNPNAPFNVNGIDGTIFGVPTPPGTAFEVQNFFSCDDVTIICQPPQPIDRFHFLIQPGLGNVGRNTFITPGRQDWNLSVTRNFRIHENHALLFRAEFFDAFNHPNLGINGAGETPDLTLVSPNFDNIARTRFGGRQIKLWLRYSF